LPARNEPFDAGKLRLDLELWKSTGNEVSKIHCDNEMRDVPIFLDRLRIEGMSEARRARWGLAGQEAVGTLLATPATREHVESIRELIDHEPFAAVSLVDGVLVLRALAPQAEAVRNLFISAWRCLRPRIVGREAVLPRIWNT
jgi:urease accessory protein